MFEFMMEMRIESARRRPPPEDPPAPPGADRPAGGGEDREVPPTRTDADDPAAPTKRVELASPDGSGFGVSGERVKPARRSRRRRRIDRTRRQRRR